MDAEGARDLFAPNAATYDRVNTVISIGLDARWRRWAARTAVTRPGARVLDAFAGTGLVGIDAALAGGDVTLADASAEMLARAEATAAARGAGVCVVTTDLAAAGLPFAPRSFDAVTVSFGVRYLDDPASVLSSLRGLLAEDGRLVVLEFVRPPAGHPLSWAASVYFFRILPSLASALAGRRDLYDYLVTSVDRIGTAEDLARTVEAAGYEVCERRAMGFELVEGLVCRPRA